MIRKANLKDVPELAALWKELMRHHLGLCRKGTADYELREIRLDGERIWSAWIRKNIRSRDSLVLVAEDEGSVVGYSLNFIKPNIKVFKIRKLGHMSDLYVKKGYRNKGIGSSLMYEASSWFNKMGIRHLSIAYHSCNPDAGRLYEENGFLPFHTEMRKRI